MYFEYDDVKCLIYSGTYDVKIRLLWGNFDSDWDITAFKRTKKKVGKKLDLRWINNVVRAFFGSNLKTLVIIAFYAFIFLPILIRHLISFRKKVSTK